MALKHGFRKLDFCVIRICSFKISRLSERVPILMVEIEFTVNEHSQTPKHFGSITFYGNTFTQKYTHARRKI